MKGLDGIQGPVYVGTGCVFNRQALYGYGPNSKPTTSKSSFSLLKMFRPSNKYPLEVGNDAMKEDLDAAIFNLQELNSE